MDMRENFMVDYRKAIDGVASPVDFETYLYRRLFTREAELKTANTCIKEFREENKLLKNKIYQVIGWCHADACIDLDKGVDPRQKEVPDFLERCKQDCGLDELLTPTTGEVID